MGNVVPECLLWHACYLLTGVSTQNTRDERMHVSSHLYWRRLDVCCCFCILCTSHPPPVFVKRDKGKLPGFFPLRASQDRVDVRNKGRTIWDWPLECEALSASTAAETSATLCFIPPSYHFFSLQDISRVLFPGISNLTETLIEWLLPLKIYADLKMAFFCVASSFSVEGTVWLQLRFTRKSVSDESRELRRCLMFSVCNQMK